MTKKGRDFRKYRRRYYANIKFIESFFGPIPTHHRVNLNLSYKFITQLS